MAERYVTLTCTSCGANIDVFEDMMRFACGYCGAQTLVERRGGTIALRRVTEAIGKVQKGAEQTVAELAIPRFVAGLIEKRRRVQEFVCVFCMAFLVGAPLGGWVRNLVGGDIFGFIAFMLVCSGFVLSIACIIAFFGGRAYARRKVQYLEGLRPAIEEAERELAEVEARLAAKRANCELLRETSPNSPLLEIAVPVTERKWRVRVSRVDQSG